MVYGGYHGCIHIVAFTQAVFGYRFQDAKNKPSAIVIEKGEAKMRQTASQMWCLLRLLPFMIGSKVPENDEKWDVFLQLKDIVEYMFCPALTEASTYVLEWMIESHHDAFLQVCQVSESETPYWHS